MRDPRYAPARLEVEKRAGGEVVLRNPTPLKSPFQVATDALDHWAAATPARPWLAERSGEGWRGVAFGEARERVAALAGGLTSAGLGTGTPLLILARNGVDTALVSYAAMSQGTPIAPVSPQYGLAGADLSRLAHAAALVRPAAVFVDDAAAFSGALEADFLSGLPVIAAVNPRPGDLQLERFFAAAPAPWTARPEDIAKLLLTSGSTGAPKAVIGLHRALAITADQVACCYDDPDPPVVVNSSPWSHSLGSNAILHMVLHRGGTLYIDAGAPAAGRFEPTVRALSELSPTYHNMVPAGWDLLATELERDENLARSFFARLRVMQYGGAGLGQSTCDRVEAMAVRTVGEAITFASGFGATETGPTAMNTHWRNRTAGLLGLPVPQTAVKLTPHDGRLVLGVKGPQVSPGYYNAPAASAAAFDDEGFYRLGDAARPVNPDRFEEGLMFDGRLSENFKLSSGIFVSAGAVRIGLLSAIGGAAADAVVCGENEAGIGVMLFLNAPFCRSLAPEAGEGLAQTPAVRAVVAQGLARFNGDARGLGGRIARALILEESPDGAAGEITDKGYINQALSRARRPGDLARLFAPDPDPAVITF
jgi:feruloyl-CoA synthase